MVERLHFGTASGVCLLCRQPGKKQSCLLGQLVGDVGVGGVPLSALRVALDDGGVPVQRDAQWPMTTPARRRLDASVGLLQKLGKRELTRTLLMEHPDARPTLRIYASRSIQTAGYCVQILSLWNNMTRGFFRLFCVQQFIMFIARKQLLLRVSIWYSIIHLGRFSIFYDPG